MTKTWTDFKVKDIALDAKNITVAVLMILNVATNAHIRNVRSFMGPRDLLIYTSKLSMEVEIRLIEKKLPSLLFLQRPTVSI
jgi:hypothetical protein